MSARSFKLCYITDRLTLGSRPLAGTIQSAISAGIDLIQIREKDLDTRPLFELAQAAAASVPGTATHVLVNDRLDVALTAGAHGVHLAGQSMPVEHVRAVVPPGFQVGVSCHSVEGVRASERAGADYALLGPIFETASKLRYGPPLGLAVLERAARQVRRMPVLALGGINVERVPACLAAGAAGVAGISIFQQCDSLEERVSALRAL
ncbi:MAG TPA: thiamine phosphate synthase [Terriglobia bacterium]|nr:thiamine phosphate synthase [Terriglobia bacterium]